MSEVLLTAVRGRHGLEEIQALLDEGADINYQNNESRITALHEAALNLDTATMAFLIAHGADVHLMDIDEKTALNHVYAEYLFDNENDLLPAIDLLLAANINPHHTYLNGDSLIQWASFNGHLTIVQRLLATNVPTPEETIQGAIQETFQELVQETHLTIRGLLIDYLNNLEPPAPPALAYQ